MAEAAKLGPEILTESAAILDYASRLPGSQRDHWEARAKSLLKHARVSEGQRAIKAALGLAECYMQVRPDALDANPLLLGLPGGVLDLVEGEVRPHQPADYITRIAGCAYDADATCARWEAFLAEVLPDPEVRLFMQKVIGYSLSAKRGEHIVVMLLGAGCNGKSVMLNVWAALLGELAVAAPSDLLTTKHNGHPAELAMLRGARLAHLAEPLDGRLAVERLKALSGGDRIAARHMNRDFFEFTPVCLMAVALNNRLRTNDAGAALWRRVREIDFPVIIPPERRQLDLADALRAELPGVLNWAIRGWNAYRAEGLAMPQAVQDATDAYREQSDPIGTFLEERCERGKSLTVTSAELYRSFSAWARDAGELPLSRRVLAERLTAVGFVPCKLQHERQWRGLALKLPEPP